MKVVLLSTRRLRAHMIDTAREELGLDPAEAEGITVVSWNPPIGRLRVAQHLVVGPILHPTGAVRFARVDPIEEPSSADRSEDQNLDDENLDDEDTDDSWSDVDADADDSDGRTGARRVAHGLKWRANRARLTVQRHPLAKRVGKSTKVRRLRNAITPGGVATHFALGCNQSAAVRRTVAEADLVVALDQNSHRAAWLLARRIPGPDVVVGIPAAARLVALTRDGGLS